MNIGSFPPFSSIRAASIAPGPTAKYSPSKNRRPRQVIDDLAPCSILAEYWAEYLALGPRKLITSGAEFRPGSGSRRAGSGVGSATWESESESRSATWARSYRPFASIHDSRSAPRGRRVQVRELGELIRIRRGKGRGPF